MLENFSCVPSFVHFAEWQKSVNEYVVLGLGQVWYLFCER